ncbi:helicase protein [Leptotrichia sp. oral taxon 215 str. W9775]|jgi:type I site-specific deoxyribonuclease|uniref:DEAD/DEAH box helicase family protein n=1 Tax=Leptotrichia sp. oral taxon 215 TaxID=712359 RepID=UPI0003AE0CBA|nr:DEAD/DEAH box helicase family protein [Leptotrichia sp. oral taxon 215]ERK66038.1 helicase protein [Leptotrichia sp. oral taxon 215 str. W9775]
MSNFEFLKKDNSYKIFADACIEAEQLMNVSYSATVTFVRKALELAVKWVYANDAELRMPPQINLASLIKGKKFKDILPYNMSGLLSYIQQLGNKAVHSGRVITREEAVLSLRNLFSFTAWIDYSYSRYYSDVEFDESILGETDKIIKVQSEKDKLSKQLAEINKKLEELSNENQTLRKENEEKRKINEKEREYKIDEISEAETRKRYIDLVIENEGWTIGEDCIPEVEISGITTPSGKGKADYVLYGDNGVPLAVIEAKKLDIDPLIGKNQAKEYADALEKKYDVRPIIFFTNGLDYYIWDDLNYPERQVSSIYSKKDLEKLIFRRGNKKPLKNVSTDIKDEITNRVYQKEAVVRVTEALEKGYRKMLLVMATGSGKTRTAASIVDILTRYNWVKNILFLADRTALVKQAKNSFKEYLPNLSLCNLLDNKDDVESRMIFSTYPTMMNAIDETKNKDGSRIFTSGYFDLIIVDESHRSIYKKYQAIFDYFDANLLGLTATPKNDIDKNTYRIFDLENDNPTFAYELDQAIEEGYLVHYGKPIDVGLKIVRDGLKYSELSEEEKEEFEETFDEEKEEISSEEVNKTLFNKETVDLVIKTLMNNGLKVEGGDKLGKTIIFAVNQRHANFIVDRFNKLYPEYKGKFAQAVCHDIKFVDDVIDNFKDKVLYPQIAVSVDMLDTGIDVPEILNLVFFKKIRSKAKFWQMIGRGTRLCKDLFGPGIDKERFMIFDCYKNFEFFEVNVDGKEIKTTKSISESIFGAKVDIIKSLQHLNYQEKSLIEYRNNLIDDIITSILDINNNRFDVRMKGAIIDKYKKLDNYKALNEKDVQELKNIIAPLITYTEEEELSKRFDYQMYVIENAYLGKKSFLRAKNRVIETAEKLSEKGTIEKISKKKETITKIQKEEFWKNADLFQFEEVRKELRELVILLDRITTKIYYTDFRDEIVDYGEHETEENFKIVNKFEKYNKRVEKYLDEYKNDDVIQKLKNNIPLTMYDIKYLEKILWEDLGTKEEYEKTYGKIPLLKMVSKIIGMDRKAVEKEFSLFLSNENLNSDQINFVKHIVDYIVKNGSIDKKELKDFPEADKFGGLFQLFDNKRDVLTNIVKIIDKVNDRLDLVQ